MRAGVVGSYPAAPHARQASKQASKREGERERGREGERERGRGERREKRINRLGPCVVTVDVDVIDALLLFIGGGTVVDIGVDAIRERERREREIERERERLWGRGAPGKRVAPSSFILAKEKEREGGREDKRERRGER